MQAAAKALDREADDAYAGYQDDEEDKPYGPEDLDGGDLAGKYEESKKQATRRAYDKQFRKFEELVFSFLPEFGCVRLRSAVAEVLEGGLGDRLSVPANLAAMEWVAEVAVQDSFELADTAPENLIVQRLKACKSWQAARADYVAKKLAGDLDESRPRAQGEVLEKIQATLQSLAQVVGGKAGESTVEPLQTVAHRPAMGNGVPSLAAVPTGPAIGALKAGATPASNAGKPSKPRDIPELAHWPEGVQPWPKFGQLQSMENVYMVYYISDPSVKKPPLQLLENKYGPAWHTEWRQRWHEFKKLSDAIDETAKVRKKGLKEAAQFWTSKQGNLTVDQQRGFIKKLHAGEVNDESGQVVTFEEYVSSQRPSDFRSPPKVKVHRPQLFLVSESPTAQAANGAKAPKLQGLATTTPCGAAAALTPRLALAANGAQLAPSGESPSTAAALAVVAQAGGAAAALIPRLALAANGVQLAHSGESPSTAAALAVAAQAGGAAAALTPRLALAANRAQLARSSGSPSTAAALAVAAQAGGAAAALTPRLALAANGAQLARSGESPSTAAALAVAVQAGGAGTDVHGMLATGLQQLQQLLSGNPALAALSQPHTLSFRLFPGPALMPSLAPAANGAQLPGQQGAAAVGSAGAPPSSAAPVNAASAPEVAREQAPGIMMAAQGRGVKRKISGGAGEEAVPGERPKKVKPLSGYMLFVKERKAENKMAKATGEAVVMSSRDETAALAAEWKQLGPGQASFNKRARGMNAEAHQPMQ